LEPGNVEHKFYARGIGFVLSVVVKGGQERLASVNIVREPVAPPVKGLPRVHGAISSERKP